MGDIYSSFDFGYDPDTIETCPIATLPPPPKLLPSRATVNPAWLPPIGHQMTPSCFVWSTIYGLATYNAARAGNYTPAKPSLQASPYYAYIKILQAHDVLDSCAGGQISWCFNLLHTENGTPNLEQAPEPAVSLGGDACGAAWSSYGGSQIPSDLAFGVAGCSQINIKDSNGLAQLRAMIAKGTPLAYGTSLYTDFPGYGVPPSSGIVWPIPYVGNNQILAKNGKAVGHCMMIIGYDDEMGAVLIQNSFGPDWGIQWNGGYGYIWMAYKTFQTLAQGGACFISET